MKRRKDKIILTGYRATGKSSVGRLLAGKLGFQFVDTDLEIEKTKGQSISDMIAEQGWPFFRQVEDSFLLSLVDKGNIVAAPGGGAILHQQTWTELMKTSLVVWLKADVQTICSRLTQDALSQSQRPSLTGQDMLQEVESVLREREPLYRAGSHCIVETGKALIEVVDEIEQIWKSTLLRG